MKDTGTEQFVRLLMANEPDLYSYTFALLPNAADARDVMQEAAVAMWQHFQEYDPARPFFPWASRFAYYGVLSFRKRNQQSRRFLSDEAVDALAQDYRLLQPAASARVEALRVCLEKLPAPARRVLDQHYEGGKTIQDISRRTGRSVNTLYKAMGKIRHWLLDCITQSLVAEGVR